MSYFSYIYRGKKLQEVSSNIFDLIIIGGGITGVGTALDAATRGLKVLLLEMQDFSSGTSSRSTKLVHGGLRYLKQFEVKMVAEVGKEREIVYLNAPHVTKPVWMLLPIYKEGTFGKFSTGIGLKVYDFLAGVKKSERRKMLTRTETIEHEPLLKESGLLGGGYYVEYRTDDSRLTIEVAKKAHEKGAVLINYAKVEGFIYSNQGKLEGVQFTDQFSNQSYTAKGKNIVNATGPWVEKLIGKDEKIPGKHLQHTKGVHIVISQEKFPLKQAIYFDTADGRMVFAIPRDGKAYIGTTDTVYNEDLENPKITPDDKRYLLKCIHDMFPAVQLTEEDIESSWAGVRPLIHQEGKGPSEISRKDEIWESSSGLITIAGGKLTGYRKMSEQVVDYVLKKNNIRLNCKTKDLRLSGGDYINLQEFKREVQENTERLLEMGIDRKHASWIAERYGSNCGLLIEGKGNLRESNLPLEIKLLLQYAIDFEMVMTPVDFLLRRTGMILFNVHKAYEYKNDVVEYMNLEFEWSLEEKEKMIQLLEQQFLIATN